MLGLNRPIRDHCRSGRSMAVCGRADGRDVVVDGRDVVVDGRDVVVDGMPW